MLFDYQIHKKFIRDACHIAKNTSFFDMTLNMLDGATFKDKPGWMPFGNALTTIGNTIYVPLVALTWSLADRCGVLLHEGVHIGQYKRLTVPGFLFLYSFNSKRLSLEAEAFDNTIRWLAVSGMIKRQTDYNRYKSNPMVGHVVGQLQNDYGLSSVSAAEFSDRFAKVLVDTFSELPL